MSEISEMYRDTYRIVNSVSRYVSYRETSVSLQPYCLLIMIENDVLSTEKANCDYLHTGEKT